jgi:transcriptional regulator with XRE-family HTH domain
MELGDKISKLRKGKNIPKSELARRINISKVQLGRYEEGSSQPTATVLANLARELECTTDYLLMQNDSIGHVDKEYLNRVVNNFNKLGLKDQLEILNYLTKYFPVNS